MKRYIFSLFALFTMLNSMSCQKIIQLDVSNSSPVLFIEAKVKAGNKNHTVLINRTIDIGSNVPDRISGAKITIKDDKNRVGTFQMDSAGYYSLKDFFVYALTPYTIQIDYDNKSYTATSSAQIGVEKMDFSVENNGNIAQVVDLKFTDTISNRVLYRINVYVNQYKIKNNYMVDNSVKDEKNIVTNKLIIFNSDDKIKIGDTVRIKVQTINQQTSDFYKNLNQLSSNRPSGSTTSNQGNPYSIFSGALGYFNLCSEAEKTKVITELVEN